MPSKKPAAQHHRKDTDCAICKGIPDYKFVETLHTSERLPEEVDQLDVIGGYGLYGSEQVRKCPTCGAFYSFLHDQSIIRRISVQELRETFENSEVIEDYPTDKYGPSCLIFGTTQSGRPLHVQCSYPSRPLVKIITLYEPDPARWIDYRRRR